MPLDGTKQKIITPNALKVPASDAEMESKTKTLNYTVFGTALKVKPRLVFPASAENVKNNQSMALSFLQVTAARNAKDGGGCLDCPRTAAWHIGHVVTDDPNFLPRSTSASLAVLHRHPTPCSLLLVCC